MILVRSRNMLRVLGLVYEEEITMELYLVVVIRDKDQTLKQIKVR